MVSLCSDFLDHESFLPSTRYLRPASRRSYPEFPSFLSPFNYHPYLVRRPSSFPCVQTTGVPTCVAFYCGYTLVVSLISMHFLLHQQQNSIHYRNTRNTPCSQSSFIHFAQLRRTVKGATLFCIYNTPVLLLFRKEKIR